jgi:hypothetical protein
MKKLLILASASAAGLVAAIAFGTFNLPEANAGEYCRTDATAHMRSCGFDTMEQCQAMRYGLGGDCDRNPFLSDNKDALAYQPKSSHTKHGAHPAGTTAHTSQ